MVQGKQTRSVDVTPTIYLTESGAPTAATKKLYFVNELVEWDLTRYLWTGCTDMQLRDSIMSHANELIRQIIRKQGLHAICPGRDESSFWDLLIVGWMQIERVLYKYRAKPYCRACFHIERPYDSLLCAQADDDYAILTMEEALERTGGCCPRCRRPLAATPLIEPQQGTFGGSSTILYKGVSKVFNLWSQVARTVCLAYIKREGRDKKNSVNYQTHLANRNRTTSEAAHRFISEARDVCRHNDEHLQLTDALERLLHEDPQPYDGIVSKLVERTRLSKHAVTSYLRYLRMHSAEFTDSPASRKAERRGFRRERDDDEEQP